MNEREAVLVLGCGVSGLSTGIELLGRGYSVTIWAKDLPPHTNSDTAAAVWYPYLCSPKDRSLLWARDTFKHFQDNFLHNPDSGVMLRMLTKYFDKLQPEPWWKDAYPNTVERPAQSEFPDGYVDAYCIMTIVIDTSIYMPFLVKIFQERGGKIFQKEVSDIQEALEDYSTVINCTALGSRELFKDMEVYPVRGQMVKIPKSNFEEVIVDDDGPNCLAIAVARQNDIVLGGTVQENDWETDSREEDTARILQKVINIAPQLRIDGVTSTSVGLRPAREEIRLEAENFSGKTIVHNYGHGGAGFTLSWGCAKEVADIVDSIRL